MKLMTSKHLKYHLPIILAIMWILLLSILGSWMVKKEEKFTKILLMNEARIHFLKDQAFRSWTASYGGVYVPISERTTPSPYLSHIVDRDIVTTSGKVLTLMNPAWVLRQLMEDYEKLYGIKGHITSLNPIRIENKPDEWERRALESFERGIKEVEELSEIDGKIYLRFMSPMITKQSCLKCHAEQGYKEGDIRGGVSVSVPGALYYSIADKNIQSLLLSLTIIGLIGLLTIIIASYIIHKRVVERGKARFALKNAQNYITNIIDSMPAILIGLDKQGNITHWNLQAEQIIGKSVDSVVGLALEEVIPRLEADINKINKAIKTRQTVTESRRPIIIENKIHYENIVIYPLISDDSEGAVIYLYDVTEQVEMEEIMIQNDKMLSVGGLAAGMAHEINNPLAGIIQTVGVLSKRLQNTSTAINIKAAKTAGTTMEAINTFMVDRDILRMLQSITDSGKRASEIVQNMLSFARKSTGEYSTHSLKEIIDNSIEIAATDYDLKKHYDFKSIRIIKSYEQNIPDVICEKSKIQQVIINILSNGSQAMHDAIVPDPQFKISLNLLKNEGNEKVVIEIEDNGPGMDEQIQKRIFEPFFTTKPVGEGTGLGLSVSYFIITEIHDGEMLVESSLGKGAKFIIRLPVST